MPKFPQLPAADRELLLNKFNELGLDPPPPTQNCECERTHNCHEQVAELVHIEVNGETTQTVHGCAICGNLRAQNGSILSTTKLSVVVQALMVKGAEKIVIKPTIKGQRLRFKPRKLELGTMLNFLKTDVDENIQVEA
ncbi:MAG: hypothetical protein WCV85_05630 [Patescibacteria group bacterium]|jgi:hypothetical protein